MSDPLSTSAKRPLSDSFVATSDAYSLYKMNHVADSFFRSSSIKISVSDVRKAQLQG